MCGFPIKTATGALNMKAPRGRRSMIRHLAAPRRRATAVEAAVRRSRAFAFECGSARRQRCLLNPEWTCRYSTHKVGLRPRAVTWKRAVATRAHSIGLGRRKVYGRRGMSDRARPPPSCGECPRNSGSDAARRHCPLRLSPRAMHPKNSLLRRANSRCARPNDGFPVVRQSSARLKRQETWNAPVH